LKEASAEGDRFEKKHSLCYITENFQIQGKDTAMIKCAVFDFDGTLADSVEFCLAVFDKVFQKYMGSRAPDHEAVYKNFGMNEPGVIRFFMGETNKEAEEDFYAFHRGLHPQMCPEPFPGVIEMLDFLRSRGIPMVILTGRSETTCNISLDFLDMQKYFCGAKYGSPEKNDKAAQLRELMAERGFKCDELIYVGDAVSDVTACRAAGVPCLTAAWASSARLEELEKVNPGLIFRSVGEMQKYIAEHL
jgi:phosphoglycolate phosphatase